MNNLKDPRTCYECGKKTPPPTMNKTVKVCDDDTETCYFINVKVHEECMR